MAIEIQKHHAIDNDGNREFKPGTWFPISVDGERSAIIVCPECKHASSFGKFHPTVSSGHAIASDGTISPSVVCPYDGCTWHVFVRLVGW